MSNLENFNLENFVLHYNSIRCFCNPRNIYHKNTESHESTKILTLEIFRLYGMSYLKGQSKGLLSRWYLKITQYLPNLIFEHKPGKSNEAADALSRAPVRMEVTSDSVCLMMQVVPVYPEEALLQNIRTQQSEDEEIVNITNYLERKILPTDAKEAQHIAAAAKKGYFVLVDGVLYYEIMMFQEGDV